MKTEHKIYAGLAVLALGGVGIYFSRQSKAKELEQHSSAASSADAPTISVPKDEIEKVTKLEITNPGKEKDKDPSQKTFVVLEKKGDTWEVEKPVAAKANAANVKSLLDNFKDLKVKETIDHGIGSYKQYDLDDDKAVHVVAYKGAERALDMYFGKSGSRGQMARIGGKDGVYVVGGYSSYLYTREVKNWRETSILKFEDANVIQADIVDKSGEFSFSKNGDKWSASFSKRDKDGKLEKSDKEWKKFDEAKVKDMLRAYKALNAEDFADDKADTGLANAEENGGIVKIKLKDNGGDFTIKVGKVAKGSSRYAVKEPGDGTVYVLSSWAADWAVAAPSKFEKADDKKGDKKDKTPDVHPPMPDEEE